MTTPPQGSSLPPPPAPTLSINLPDPWPKALADLAKHQGLSLAQLRDSMFTELPSLKAIACAKCQETFEVEGVFPPMPQRPATDPWGAQIYLRVFNNRYIELSNPNGVAGYICSSCVSVHSGAVAMMIKAMIGSDPDKLNAVGNSQAGNLIGWLLSVLEPPKSPRLAPAPVRKELAGK